VLDEMCALFQEGSKCEIPLHALNKHFGVDARRASALYRSLMDRAAIVERENTYPTAKLAGRATYVEIGPRICEIAAAVRADLAVRNAPVDRVDAAAKWVRSHRVLSRLAGALMVLTALATLVNQSLQIVQRLSPAAAPPASEPPEGR
jgi:hypothetical protein